jgi:uroporphyrinogen decarboxylase
VTYIGDFDVTHKQRAKIALTGGQPDYVPTFELVFHETEQDFDGRIFSDLPDGPKVENSNYARLAKYNADLYVDIAQRFEHSIIFIQGVATPQNDPAEWLCSVADCIRHRTGDEYFIIAHGDPTFAIPDKDMLEFCTNLYDKPQQTKDMARRNVDKMMNFCGRLMCNGFDGFALCSDYAFNSGPFLSVEHFHEFVAPYLKEIISFQHELGAVVIKHTDGNIEPILDTIVECGPDALHSIDPMAGMDIKSVKDRYGDRIALCGNVHCAFMQTGTAEQIRDSAEYCLTYGKPDGGYVFSTSNCVFRGMPLESYYLIHEIWRKHRVYSKTHVHERQVL